MFARAHRFSFKKGAPKKTYSAPFFVIRYDKNEVQNLECAVVVGKKVDKRAVERNKLKRQIVAIIKDILTPETPVKIAIFAKRQLQETSEDQKREELTKAFKYIHIL